MFIQFIFKALVAIFVLESAAALAVSVPTGKQNCFRSGSFLPKLVFKDLLNRNETWLGYEGDLTEVYAYRSLAITERKKGDCPVCFTLYGLIESDDGNIEIKIVTGESEDEDNFATKVLSRSNGKSWTAWYASLTCR